MPWLRSRLRIWVRQCLWLVVPVREVATVGTPPPLGVEKPPGFGPPQGASYSLYHWYHNTPLHRENHVIGFTSFNRSDGKYKGLPPSYPTGFILPR